MTHGCPAIRPEPWPGDHWVAGAEPHRQREGLRVRDDEARRQRLDLRKGEALDVLPGRGPAPEGVARGVAHHEERGGGQRQHPARGESPLPVARLRHRVGEILILHRVRGLRYGGLHEALAATGGSVIHPRQLDDAEKLIPQARERAPQQARGVLEPPLAPDPAMPFQGDAQAERRGPGGQDAEPHPARGFP